ncbi:MAG: hypothetical protein HYZ29_10885 [Myxococcales bacterium]|nr:hypothetical protein [Myxococcales bacterium]
MTTIDDETYRTVLAEVDLGPDPGSAGAGLTAADDTGRADTAFIGDTSRVVSEMRVGDSAEFDAKSGEIRMRTGLDTVFATVAESAPPVPTEPAVPAAEARKRSPARRRVELQRGANALRGQVRTRRTLLAAERAKDQPDADKVAELESELDALDAQLLKLDLEIEDRMERDARRADRDCSIRALDRDPRTGKVRNGPYAYDPRLPEMQALYADKATPQAVFADGAKLIRNDGGQYGLAGGVLRALLDGAARAGESLSPRLQIELTKAMCWDAVERIHGIGSGYCRDAAWIIWLWSQLTGTSLDPSILPQRKPLREFGEWVTSEFDEMYAEALVKLGLGSPVVADSTAADLATGEGA